MIRSDSCVDASTHGANKAGRCCILTKCAPGFVCENVADLILYNIRSGKGTPEWAGRLPRHPVVSSRILRRVRPHSSATRRRRRGKRQWRGGGGATARRRRRGGRRGGDAATAPVVFFGDFWGGFGDPFGFFGGFGVLEVHGQTETNFRTSLSQRGANC